MTQVDNSGTPTGPHVVLNIGYDNMQRQTSLSATVAGTLDFLNNYAYNADSAITQITQQGQTGGNTVAAKLVNFAFDNDGRLTTASRYANLSATQLVATSTYGYDANSDITSLSQDKGGTNLNSSTYSYDHDGRVTGDSTVDGTDSFSYDAASQLTAATHSYETNETYSFDSTGNRTNTGYSTGTNNQLSSDGTYNYLYDANGNMTKQTTIATGAYVTYAWDYHNRLTDVESYNSSNVLQSHVHYIYNVFDQLIERQVDPTGGGTYTTTQAFVYDPSGNIVLVYNGSGALTDRMLNGPGANNALADENGSGTVSWLLADNEGTIRDVVQYNSGTNTTTVVDHLEYNSFGVITAQSNSGYQPLFAYTGQMWDAAAGLYYYHARWYDASTGRFVSQDPMSFAAGDPNLYRYVGNSPTNLIDPTGTDSTDSAATAQQMAQASQQMQQGMQAQQAQQDEQMAQSQQTANAGMMVQSTTLLAIIKNLFNTTWVDPNTGRVHVISMGGDGIITHVSYDPAGPGSFKRTYYFPDGSIIRVPIDGPSTIQWPGKAPEPLFTPSVPDGFPPLAAGEGVRKPPEEPHAGPINFNPTEGEGGPFDWYLGAGDDGSIGVGAGINIGRKGEGGHVDNRWLGGDPLRDDY